MQAVLNKSQSYILTIGSNYTRVSTMGGGGRGGGRGGGEGGSIGGIMVKTPAFQPGVPWFQSHHCQGIFP